MIRALIISIALSLFAVPAHAEVNVRGLSEAQKAELEAAAAQLRLENETRQNVTLGDVTVDDVQRYADIGNAVAQSIGAAAKELGIATNEFMNTSAGKLAVFLIVYHFIGGDLLTLLVGVVLSLVFTWIYVKFSRFVKTDNSRTETNETMNEKGKIADRKTVTRYDYSETTWVMYTIATIVYMGSLAIIAANCLP